MLYELSLKKKLAVVCRVFRILTAENDNNTKNNNKIKYM